MRLSLLGPLLVDGSPGSAVLGAAKERSLLATLALNPGAVVSTDSLIAAVWGDDPPATARKTLQTYIWNLRQSLGTEVIATEPPGYALRIAPGDVDVGRFRSLVRDGEAAMGAGDAARASVVLRDATALWRGEPFGAVAAHTGLAGEAVRLKEEYASAIETRVSADLAVSRHAELVGDLEALVHDHPFRERLWGHLMVALYRCGRQADALATYKRARERLVEELGLEPGGELRRVEEAILNHDPALAAPHALGAPLATACGAASGVLRSPVRYARSSDGVSIAYQVAGDGPVDILAIPGFVTHLDIWWNAPTDGLVRQLTSIGRLISFDKRGMGLSDRPESVDAMKWVDDALAVLDAAGAKEVVVLGVSAGTPTAIRVASMHRERVRALVVFGGGARTIAGPGYEIGHDRATVESFAANLERGWGSGVAISSYAPSRAKEPHVRDYWARYQQLSAAPAAAIRYFWAAAESDVTELLATISTPTLVLHPERDIVAPVTWGRFMADHIPGAKFVTLDSDVDLICVSDVIDDMAREIDEFIRRDVLGPNMGGVEPALVTVLAVRVRDDHRSAVESVIERCGGRLQGPATTAIFDAPSCAARCASRVVDEVTADEVGVGIHTGECFHSNAGYRGGAVDVAHQLAAAAAPGEVLLTSTVSDLVADGGLCVEQRAIALPAHRGGIVALASPAAPSRS